jgi:RHS repeat-associated protein
MRVMKWSVWMRCLVFAFVLLPLFAGTASAEESSALGGAGASPLENPLVVPEAQPLLGSESVGDAEEARRTAPEAVAAREESRTKFEGLNTEQADTADAEAFPELLKDPLGGPPSLLAGQKIVGFPSDNVAQVDLGDGKRGVIEATEPMAVEDSSGQRTPIDLGLNEVGSVFEPATPVVGVSIPKRLSGGVQLPALDLSFTPVDRSGSPLGGSEGTSDVVSVLYANTQTDTDTVVKPTAGGFEVDTLLRSADSPEQLYFRVGLPEGASLVQGQSASGAVSVVVEGNVVAAIRPPGATDAAGTFVPVSMSVKGDVLALTVASHGREYQYPIMVDPTVEDPQLIVEPGNWAFATNDPAGIKLARTSEAPVGIEGSHESVPLGDWGILEYPTQGKSRVYEAKVDTVMENSRGNRNSLAIENPSKKIESNGGSLYELPWEYEAKTVICVEAGCAVPTVTTESESNVVNMEVMTKETCCGSFEAWLMSASVFIVQEAGPTFGGFDTTGETTATGLLNGLYGHKWENTNSGRWGVQASATDPGLGIKHAIWSSPNAPKWGGTTEVGECKSEQCDEAVSPTYALKDEAEQLPDGEDIIDLKVEDPVGLNATGVSGKIKVDNTPPHTITLSGLPSTHEIGDGEHLALTASATDGSGTESSGVASIVLAVDGQQVGSPSGGCSPGTCTAKGEWTISAENYSAGKHTITVTATDNAGNVAKEEFELTIHHAAPVAVGPGAVNPVTGELSLGATDVSVNAPDGTLTVARTYRSRHPGSLAEGPLGPQWALSLGASESLYKTPSGNMVLTGPSGEESVFANNGKGGYTSPPGDAGMNLTASGSKFLLTENGAVTTFAEPTGGSGSVWEPSVSEGAGGTDATTFAYRTEGGVTEPTEELAPVPSGVSCSPTLTKGCRALSFVYAEKTKESIGESQSEWGEYKGRLKEVLFTAYEPSSKEMKTKAVAQYSYDKQGRLRAEWNPQISPALKTMYGDDALGHVTALAQPGQQPWLIEQGTSAKDGSSGRVLAVARTAATTEAALKTELAASAPVNTVAPTLSSTTPTVGVKISVSSNGTWSNSPLAYSYQWDDCNPEGNECTAILGAVNQAYYPVTSDEGHTLVAEVVALNANGSVATSSAATSKVATGTPSTPLPEPPSVGSLSVWTIDYQVPLSGTETALPKMSATEVAKWGQTDDPAEGLATAVFPPDKPMGWPAKEYTRASIYYLDGRDRAVNVSTPSGGISTTEYNLDNDIVRTLIPDNRATALAAGEAKSKELSKELDSESTYEEGGSEPGIELLSSLGPKHVIQLANGTKVEARAHTVYSYNEGAPTEGGPYRLPTKITQGAQYSGKEEDVRTTKTGYSGQEDLGWKLRKPTSVTTDPTGLNLTHSTFYEPNTGNVTETRLPAAGAPKEEQESSFKLQFGKKGTGSGEFVEPQGIAVTASGEEYVLDTGNHRVEEFNTKGELVRTFGTEMLKEPHGISLDSEGNVWVANTGNNEIDEYSSTGGYKAHITRADVIQRETLETPQDVEVNPEGHVWVVYKDSVNEFVYIKVAKEYSHERSFGEKGSGETQMTEPQGIAIGAEGNLYISDTGNDRIDEYSSAGKHIRNFGKEGTANGQLKEPHQISTDSAGHVWIADSGNNRIEEFGSTGTFLSVFGKEGSTEGKLKAPKGVAIDSEGNEWVADTANSNVQEWTANNANNAHETQTIYYTTAANSKYPGCGEHPEWANLPCQTQPAKQPETSSLWSLPVMTVTYNLWDEPEKATETFEKGTEKTVRTKTDTYDGSGRLEKAAVSSTVGTALPTITDKYNAALGVLEEQSNEGKTKPISSHYNTLGQLTSYTDAAEGTTTYEYDEDWRIKKVNDGKGTEAFTYSKTTGLVTELLNEYGTTKLTFTGTYDPEGNLLTEGYPNGMNANYTYSQTGETTGLEYKKTTHCTTGCTWYQENVVPSIHGQDLSQTNTVEGATSTDNYTYDTASRLTQVEETPAGKGCTTRIYAYDQDTNRTSLTTRAPGSEGKCATEGGTEEKHTYDEADRLTDTGTSYDAFGDITTLPAADAGGKEVSESLTSTYYTDSQLASQTQKEQTIGYKLDPAGHTLETVSTGKPVVSDVINHYAGPGSSPAWTENTTTNEWTRNIPGISGFAAVQVNGATPVLKLSDLHGDIIATAALSETETKLFSSITMTEYGVPTTTTPEKYSWLGGDLVATELPSGTIDMGVRSYVPQLGRFLQTDPVRGGSANAYVYTFGDPVNASDPGGEYTASVQGFAIESAEERSAEYLEYLEKIAAEEAAARAQAERAAHEATAALFAREAEIAGALKAAEATWCGGEYKACTDEGGGLGGGYGGGGGAFRNLEDPATGCTAHGAPGCSNSHGGQGSANEGGCPDPKGKSCPGHGEGGSAGETARNVCIALFWVPGVGEVCGGYYAGKLFGEKVSK